MTSTDLVQKSPEVCNEKVTYPAFSFFFRMHSGSEKQLHDSGHIRNRVHEVIKASDSTPAILHEIKKRADLLIDQLDFETGAQSVGLFISSEESFLKQYYIYMPERDYVGDYFSGYESSYAEQESIPYLFISLEPSVVRVYRGRGEHLETAPESKEYTHLASVYKRRAPQQADKDGKVRKGQHHDSQWKQELLEAIAELCCNEQRPVFFAGLNLADLSQVELASHGIEVLAALDETYEIAGSESLKKIIQDLMSSYKDKKAKTLLEKCKIAKGNQKLATGADEVLNCARDGRGEVLILPNPSWELSGTLKLGTQQEAIRATYIMHGKVEFVPEELMKEWGEAAMILRY